MYLLIILENIFYNTSLYYYWCTISSVQDKFFKIYSNACIGEKYALGIMNTFIRIEDDVIPINPLLIFQIMFMTKLLIKYELAQFTLLLSTKQNMQDKCVKSSLYNACKQCSGIS